MRTVPSAEIAERLRHLGHCDTVTITIDYGMLPFSTVTVSLEGIIKMTSSKQQHVIIKMNHDDPSLERVRGEIERMKPYYSQAGNIELR